jgi:LuxR family maltose regulon positive regulatory protein
MGASHPLAKIEPLLLLRQGGTVSQTTEFSPILRTKLYRPEISTAWVDRPHLLAQLDARRYRPLTLVSASAGYGKTTLVSSWLETSDTPSAWLSLDERDDDLVTFLTYFITAIQTMFPAACRDTLALLNAATLPPLPVLSRSLINELDQLEPAFTLVLDDFHLILDPAVHDLLNELMRHPPRPLHLVVISRRDPSLPITTLRARGQVTEIRSRELRFTVAETGALLQQMQGVAPEQTTAAHLTEKTEGWVTGIRLAILALRKQGDLDGLLNRLPENLHQHVADYLLAEVVSDQPAAIQAFLLKTSILSRLNGPLCDVMADLDEPEGNGQATLEWLREARLFTLPLRDQPGSYRYHHLFQEYLQNQLARRYGPADIAALHARAGSWYAQAGVVEEALHHLLAAGDTLGAAQLVEQHRHDLLNRDAFIALGKWLEMLPGELVQQRPALLLARAWVLNHQLNLQALPPILQSVEVLLDNEGSIRSQATEQSLRGEVDFFWAAIWYWQGHSRRSLECAQRSLERGPIAQPFFRSFATTYMGLAAQLAGQKEMALQTVDEAFERELAPDNMVTIRLLSVLLFIHLLSAELVESAQLTERNLKLAAEKNYGNLKTWGHYLLGYVHYEWNELKTSVHHLAQAVEKRYLLQRRAAIDSLVGLSLAFQARQQPDKANQTMKLLLEFALQTSNPTYVTIAQSCQARLSLLQGDLASATAWLQTADLSTDVSQMFIWLEVPRLTRCRALIARGSTPDLQAAVSELQVHLQAAEAGHNTLQMIHILLLQALAYQAQSKLDDALTSLERAVILARPGGFIQTFVEGGPPMAELLTRLVERGVAVDYVHQILAAFSASGSESQSPDPNQNLAEPLTRRELQTLQLLATDLSVEDIATEMVVSVATVRTHTKRIYRKLDVHSRLQADQRAKELGLL